jgi:6-phosphogluconolactonase (cycloisomerase 2 family)
MAATLTVNPQFVFVAGSGTTPASIFGFRIESDGSLSRVPQNAIELTHPAMEMFTLGNSVAVVGQSTVSVFRVDPSTGMLVAGRVSTLDGLHDAAAYDWRTVLSIATQNGEIKLKKRDGRLILASFDPSVQPHATAAGSAALTRDEHFMYVIDASANVIRAFRVQGKQTVPLTPASYPVPQGTNNVVLVSP